MKQKQKEHGHQAKPTAHINNPLDKPEDWVFGIKLETGTWQPVSSLLRDTTSETIRAKSWFEARAEAALRLGVSYDNLTCIHNPCVPTPKAEPVVP
jgi:hypothetical protein